MNTQIEEMAKILHPDRCFDADITACRKMEDCDVCRATKLYNAGYRKQEWISVTERLPTEDDADADYAILAVHKRSVKRYFHWKSVADNSFDFTHWMPLPLPPETEKGDEGK